MTQRFKMLPSCGFSLLEVLAAVAIFAGGMVVVIGLYAPVTKSIAAMADTEAAAGVAEAVRSRLLAMPFEAALQLIQDPVGPGEAGAARNPATHAASNGNSLIVWMPCAEVVIQPPSGGSAHGGDTPDPATAGTRRAFAVDLIRNAALSPAAMDAIAPCVAFTLCVHWAAHPSSPHGMTASNRGDGEVLLFTGSISR